MDQARARTSTRRPELRLLYEGIALVLRNGWVWPYLEVPSPRQRVTRTILLERLRLRELPRWLIQVIEEEDGTIGETQTER